LTTGLIGVGSRGSGPPAAPRVLGLVVRPVSYGNRLPNPVPGLRKSWIPGGVTALRVGRPL